MTWGRALQALVVLALAVLVGALAWRSRGWPLIHDAPLMYYIAWRIGEGAVPYRDLFDMNFPGVYLLHLAALRLFGAGDAGWRVFDLAWLAATSLAAAALAARWGRFAAARWYAAKNKPAPGRRVSATSCCARSSCWRHSASRAGPSAPASG